MSDQWYFTLAGLNCGPVPAGQLDELIAKGSLRDDDLVWLDGVDVQITVQSYREVNRGGSLPDLVVAFRKGQPPATVSPAPNWLADVRAYERMDAAFRPAPAVPLQAKPNLPSVPLDWLDDIRQIEEAYRPRAAVRPPAPKQTPPAPTSAAPSQSPGFDPQTGRILDADAFIRWQREQQRQRDQQRAKQPGVTAGEAFLAARKALQDWIDTEQNKALIEANNMDTIRRAMAIQGILSAYLGYGPVMQQKLMKHLEFLVENRRKFYRDFNASKKHP